MKYNEKEIEEANKIHFLQIRCNELMKENARIKAELAGIEKNKPGFCRGDDLFEDVRDSIGCMYISDMKLPAYREKAIRRMASVDLSHYSIADLEDMAEYLCGQKFDFDTREKAHEHFEEKCIQK